MAPPSPGLNPKQQRSARLVLGGMPASRAYSAADYKATTDDAAETNGSRLIKTNRVAAYLTARRGAAAARSELSLASVLKGVARLANDEKVEGSSRVSAFKLLLEHVARSTPPVRSPLPVPEAADEDDLNRRGLADRGRHAGRPDHTCPGERDGAGRRPVHQDRPWCHGCCRPPQG
jgi:hypothetical protein